MATYYPDSNNQRDAATMLYLREQLPGSYSEAPVNTENTMMYMNYNASSYGLYSDALAENNQSTELPSVGASGSSDHAFSGWRDGGNEMLLLHHQMGGGGSGPNNILQSGQSLKEGQGLSLSLGTQIPSIMQMPSIQFQNPNLALSSFFGSNPSISNNENSLDRQLRYDEHFSDGGFHGASNHDPVKADMSSYGMSSIARNNFPNSKYLKATQLLLDEVVSVRKALKLPDSDKNTQTAETQTKVCQDNCGGSKNESVTGNPSNHQDTHENSSSELPPAEKLELQNKMTKLVSMLNEVDRGYKQYYNQMQIVVSSFDVIAGYESAKPYTALALQTISCHFRCLRDAITDQIQATRKSLGEQDTSAHSKSVGISRLRYVDQQLKQQKALQQLGMMQQHTWRPQRGLPESSVSVLRAWLFEHFLHPYPKDSDKIMLARQTGLTRSQVSNWFINARVRLWKPMVEEMYKEEGGEVDMDINSSSENVSKPRKPDIMDHVSIGDMQQSPTSSATGKYSTGQLIQEMEAQPRTKQNVSTDYYPHNTTLSFNDCNLYTSPVKQPGSGVSLTLGLQHFEGGILLPMGIGPHSGFVTVQGSRIYNPAIAPNKASFGSSYSVVMVFNVEVGTEWVVCINIFEVKPHPKIFPLGSTNSSFDFLVFKYKVALVTVGLFGALRHDPASSSVGHETDEEFDELESSNGQHRFNNNSSHLLHDFVA